MNLKKNTIEELRKILEKDYKVSISKTEENSLGVSLLRLTKLSVTVLARTIAKYEPSTLKDN